jgi:hypothetical protein
MESFTVSTAISIIFLIKVLEQTGEKFEEETLAKMSQAFGIICYQAPEIAGAIQLGDKHILSLYPGLVADMIPADPIFSAFLVAADAEPNLAFQAKLPDVKAGRILEVLG